MYFCPNCNNGFDITKASQQFGGYIIDSSESESSSADNIQDGGQKPNKLYEDIIEKILSDKPVTENILELNFDDFIKSSEYKKLKIKSKELIFNKIQDLLPTEKKLISKETTKIPTDIAYFICNNCGYLKKISEGTLIFSRSSKNIAQLYATSDINMMTNSDILPRTRRYICTNDSCISHKDPAQREAIFFRMNNTYKIKYICLACKTTI